MENVIGKRVRRVDGYEKVTGKAIYGDDLKFPGMLYGAVHYTDIPAGKITKLDISNAEKMPGVKAIGLYKDVPGEKKVGPIRRDYLPIVNDEVFFTGDVIAVVAATTKEQAYEAVDAIRVEYEPYDPLTDIEEAVKPGARLIHPEYKSNIMVHYPLIKGDVEKGFSKSDRVIERKYRTGFHEHAYIELESVTIVPDHTTKGYKVYGSIQNPFTTRKVVALFMGLKLNQVNVFGSTLGGSFGGKDDIINNIACRAALLSELTGKPVKITYTREDSLKESYKRHPYIMNYKVGFNNDGKLKAMKINILADSGAYSSQTFFVTWRSVVQATGPYEIENVLTDVKGVYTNNTYTAAFRGFGSPQVIFAQESLMDEIAEICGITPLEIRKINGFKQGSITASGQKLSEHKVSLHQVIREAIEKSNYQEKYEQYKKANTVSRRYKYGIGLSCSYRGCSLGAEGTDASSAIVSVQADGSVIVFTGVNENGQGLRTTFCQITSEVLGVPLDDITFLEPQTSMITDGGPTVASRGTIVGGNATIQAANIIKIRIFEIIKDELKVSKLEETEWKNGFIYRKTKNPKIKSVKFSDAAEKAYWAGINLSAYGWFKGPDVNWVEETGQGNAYFTYVYGCQIVETRIDTHTGKIEVEKITAAHDVGKVINRIGAEGQVYGGITQGMGYGILEDYNIQNGEVKSLNLDEYLIPTIKDIKEIEPILVENPDIYGPFGAKGIGEPTLELTSAAINNSLSFALGKRSYQIPLTLEQTFLGKNLRKPARQSEVVYASDKKKKFTPRLSNIKTSSPHNLEEVLRKLADGKLKLLAGGTDVVVQARHKTESLNLLNIFSLPELKKIKETGDKLTIGAATTFTEIINNDIIKREFPLLLKACSLIGSTQIRNRATIGGNIVNSAPCADSVPPLIVYKANLHLCSSKGERIVPISKFIERHYKTEIQSDEILTAIIIPKLPDKKYYHSYYQLGRRSAVNITRMSICVMLSFDKDDKIDECCIVDGSLFSRSQRITDVEKALIGKHLNEQTISAAEKPLAEKIEKEIGGRWSVEYKKPVFINLFKDALEEINLEKAYKQRKSSK